MTWIGAAVATVGALVCLAAAVGLLRLRDTLSRLQAVTKASTLGLAFTMIGAALIMSSVSVTVKAFIVVLFLWAVMPISGHLLGRAAYRTGLAGELDVDELHEVGEHRTDLHDVGTDRRV